MTPSPYFQDEWSTLYHGDSLAIAPLLTGIDAVITDPPYGMNNDANSNRFSGGGITRFACRTHSPIAGDDKPFNPAPWLEYPIVVLWGANHFSARLPVGTSLVWIKRHPELFQSFLSDAEIGWMRGGHGVYCFYKQFPPPTRAAETGGDSSQPFTPHPNLKPIGLMLWCLEQAKVQPGQTILDPYMGSGTTLVAAKLRGIKAVGIELEERYVKIAVERLRQGVLIPC